MTLRGHEGEINDLQVNFSLSGKITSNLSALIRFKWLSAVKLKGEAMLRVKIYFEILIYEAKLRFERLAALRFERLAALRSAIFW